LTVNEFFLEDLKQVIIKVKLNLECSVGHPSSALKYLDCLIQDFIEGHRVTLRSAGISFL
jgi:hypothetical protein